MNRFLVGTSVISLLVLGGCGGGGGSSSSDVSVAGNASGVQQPQEGETAPTQTADLTPTPIELPPMADASDSNPGHATVPTIRSIVPVTNSVTEAAQEEEVGGALSETPTPPATSTSSPNPVTNQVEEEDAGTSTTGGTTNPKPPKAPKPLKTPKPGTTTGGNQGGTTGGPSHGPSYETNDGGTTGIITAAPVAPTAVATPEPVTSSLAVLAAASLAGYALRRRR